MNEIDLDRMEEIAKAATPGEWESAKLAEGFSPEGMLTYLERCIKEGRPDDFRFVYLAEHPDGKGPADICHTGNGPMSRENADYIAAARPDVLLRLIRMLKRRTEALEMVITLVPGSDYGQGVCQKARGALLYTGDPE